ncbi:hypothetical protein RRSWK_01186 [Rhodopirellula sp. SWK7]|nr:hypothetical protein RRSWK_01186 [Rhodopirellula sp. SWK7]
MNRIIWIRVISSSPAKIRKIRRLYGEQSRANAARFNVISPEA